MNATLTIPEGLHFEDLEFSMLDGEWQVDASPIKTICEANGYDLDCLNDIEFAMSVVMGWYEAHRCAGGHPNAVLEELLARPAALACGGFVPHFDRFRCDH